MSDQPRVLPVLAIVRDAFALPWRHRSEVLRVTGLPLLLLVAVSLLWELVASSQGFFMRWLSHFVYLLAFSWLATTVHRLVLLDEAGASVHCVSSWCMQHCPGRSTGAAGCSIAMAPPLSSSR